MRKTVFLLLLGVCAVSLQALEYKFWNAKGIQCQIVAPAKPDAREKEGIALLQNSFLAMGKDAVKVGANVFQFFTRNPRGYRENSVHDIEKKKPNK